MGLILIKFYYLAEERSGWLSDVASSIKNSWRREEGGHRISSLSLPVDRHSAHGKEERIYGRIQLHQAKPTIKVQRYT